MVRPRIDACEQHRHGNGSRAPTANDLRFVGAALTDKGAYG
jgi:hypothetical protein